MPKEKKAISLKEKGKRKAAADAAKNGAAETNGHADHSLTNESIERRHQSRLSLEAGGTELSAAMQPLAEKMTELKRLEADLKLKIADQAGAIIEQMKAEGLTQIVVADGPDFWEISIETKERLRVAKQTRTPTKEGEETKDEGPTLPGIDE